MALMPPFLPFDIEHGKSVKPAALLPARSRVRLFHILGALALVVCMLGLAVAVRDESQKPRWTGVYYSLSEPPPGYEDDDDKPMKKSKAPPDYGDDGDNFDVDNLMLEGER